MTDSERNAAIESNLPIIRELVRIAVGKRLEDEYLSVGVMTFIDRYPRYDPSKGAKLSKFMARAIIGECRRELWKQGAGAVAFPRPGQKLFKATGRTNYDDQYRKRRPCRILPQHRTAPSHVPSLIVAEETEKAWELVGRLCDSRQSDAVMLRLSGVRHEIIDEIMGTGSGLSFYYERRARDNMRAMVEIERITPASDG